MQDSPVYPHPLVQPRLRMLLNAATPLDAMPKAGLWWLTAQRSGGRVLIGVKAVIGPESLQSETHKPQ